MSDGNINPTNSDNSVDQNSNEPNSITHETFTQETYYVEPSYAGTEQNDGTTAQVPFENDPNVGMQPYENAAQQTQYNSQPQYTETQNVQSPYTQPQYGQEQYSQQQYTQPLYNQNQYTQPQYDQAQYDQAQYNQAQYAQQQYGAPMNQGYQTPVQGFGTPKQQYAMTESDRTLRLIAFILMVISTVSVGWAIIPLAWMIPMTIISWGIYKGEKANTVAFDVCTLIFVSLIAGILLLVSTKDVKRQ